MSDRATFQALQRSGRRSRRAPVSVTWLPGEPGTTPRVAYAISRRVGGAVVRNRVKRRLREIVRRAAPSLPAGAYLVRADPEAATASFGELETALTEAMASAGREPR